MKPSNQVEPSLRDSVRYVILQYVANGITLPKCVDLISAVLTREIEARDAVIEQLMVDIEELEAATLTGGLIG